MQRAREVIEPEALVVEYSKKSTYIDRNTGLVRSKKEDLFNGCFDAVWIDADGVTHYVQVTGGAHESSVQYRLKKVKTRFCVPLGAVLRGKNVRFHRVEVWRYVNRRGFQVWRWDWLKASWELLHLMMVPPTMRGRIGRGKNKRVPKAAGAEGQEAQTGEVG